MVFPSTPDTTLERRELEALAPDSSCEANPIDETLSRFRFTNSKSRRSGSRRGNLRNPGCATGASDVSEDVSEKSRSSIETTSNCHDRSCPERRTCKVDG